MPSRDFRSEAIERLLAEREKQGLSRHVSDPAVIGAIAAIVSTTVTKATS